MNYTYEDIAKMIDHSLLFPTKTSKELEKGIELALNYNVASVCIAPHYLKRCAKVLKGSTVAASTVIGYPLGYNTMEVKLAEARQALADGCQELDLVSNVSRVLSKDWDYVYQDLKGVIEMAHDQGQKVKVIFENSYLQDEHKIKLCEICSELNADWVKASSGFTFGVDPGATDHDLNLMLKHTPDHVQVKSSGQNRTLDEMIALKDMGITRVGIDATAQVLTEYKQRYDYSTKKKPANAPS